MLNSCERLVTEARARVDEITWQEIETSSLRGFLVDVREPHEFAERTAPGAINIPRGLLEFSIDSHPSLEQLEEEELLNSRLYLFCGTGGRSALAAIQLKKLGFTQVYSIHGGLSLLE
jgi:rhodanese-related sulfurtransferase